MKNKAKCISIKPYTEDWSLHQKLGRFAQSLDRTHDLAEIRNSARKPAPIQLVEMVF